MRREPKDIIEGLPEEPTAAMRAAFSAEDYQEDLKRAKDAMAHEMQWMGDIKEAYNLDDRKVAQVGRSYNRVKFWEDRIAKYEQLLSLAQSQPAEVTA